MVSTAAVPRTVHAPGPREFAEIVARAEPVVLTGLTDGWPALGRWRELDYLRERVGEDELPVEFYPGGDTGRHSGYVVRTMRVNDFIDGMTPGPGRPAMYLIVPLPAALAGDVITPPILDRIGRTIWLFGERTSSNLHFHPFQHSLACQVMGRKRFGLYPPEESAHLYPNPWLSKWFEFTRVDRFHPLDLGRWPRVARARGFEATIGPGESLFIPRHWWHWATTDDVASHVLYYFGGLDPARWLWTSPGRRSLFFLGRRTAWNAWTRLRRRVEARLGIAPPDAPAPTGDRPAR
jgi:hypothetical protein